MNIKDQIMEAIDNIHSTEVDVRYDTICEMCKSYDKASVILECYEGEDIDSFDLFQENTFYQEGSVSDKMKESGKKYGTLMKILTFIPRLVKALFQTIKEKFSKTKPSEKLKKAPKEEKEKFFSVLNRKLDRKKRIAILASILGVGATGFVVFSKVRVMQTIHKVEKSYNKLKKLIEKAPENVVENKEDAIAGIEYVLEICAICKNKKTEPEIRIEAYNVVREIKKDLKTIRTQIKELKKEIKNNSNNTQSSNAENQDTSVVEDIVEVADEIDNDVEELEEAIGGESPTETSDEEKPKNAEQQTQGDAEQRLEQLLDEIDKRCALLDKLANTYNKKYEALNIKEITIKKPYSVEINKETSEYSIMAFDYMGINFLLASYINSQRYYLDMIKFYSIEKADEDKNRKERKLFSDFNSEKRIKNICFGGFTGDDADFRNHDMRIVNKSIDEYESILDKTKEYLKQMPTDQQDRLIKEMNDSNMLIQKLQKLVIYNHEFINASISTINMIYDVIYDPDKNLDRNIKYDTNQFKKVKDVKFDGDNK